jgi:uncharacterized LabA/DUF88 family protein
MAVFSFLLQIKSLVPGHLNKAHRKNANPLKTIVYIDGFNLYFGCLRHTPFKWLDVAKLAERLSREQNPSANIIEVKYFTADIKTKIERRGHASYKAQQDYLMALKSETDNLSIIKGKYFITKSSYCRHADPVPFDDVVDVWRPEEKQTDVNIALHMLCDATDAKCEQMILFSNDSDLPPVLR